MNVPNEGFTAVETMTRPRLRNGTEPGDSNDLRRELRLALVCYGGVSLAVYMHGITVELQSLVAASAVFCERQDETNPFNPDCTEHVYWDALDAMARDTGDGGARLRIVLDIISGTSAGGINGIVLAKALARGLKQDPLRTVWFDKASVFNLAKSLPWLRRGTARAPLDGKLMSKWAFGALQEMNATPVQGPAGGLPLIPEGNELDLFVTTTDCGGLRRTIDLYDPQAIHDLEFRQVLQFSFDPLRQEAASFGQDDDRMLTMALRCTSSFPGAFPPVTMDEIASVAGAFGDTERTTHFNSYLLEDAEPESASFLDGGVLNNRPFDHAVDAIMTRTAGREVERRLLFIEPHPADPVPACKDDPAPARPGWLRTVADALSGIPRHQPIADALAELTRRNARASEIRQLIALTEPSVFDLIARTAKDPKYSKMDPAKTGKLASLNLDEIDDWANGVADAARAAVGVCYGPYEAIKLGEVLADLSQGLCSLPRYPVTSRHAALVTRIVQCWAKDNRLMLDDKLAKRRRVSKEDPAIAAYREHDVTRKDFLKTFDMNFRIRRLRFLIRCVNDTYAEASGNPQLRPTLDAIKTSLYGLIRQLRHIKSGEWVKNDQYQALSAQLRTLFDKQPIAACLETPAGGLNQGLDARARRFLDTHGPKLDQAFDDLGAAVRARYDEFYQVQRTELAALMSMQQSLPDGLLEQLLARYIGFSYWDAILYPLIAMSGVSEPDQVEVIRVSPNDTNLLKPETAAGRLKGISAFHFGAFLKRSFRENDFLWGRLDAVERLLGVLGSIENSGLTPARRDALRWRGFQVVLDREKGELKEKTSRDLVAGLEAQVQTGLRATAPPPSSATAPMAARSQQAVRTA